MKAEFKALRSAALDFGAYGCKSHYDERLFYLF
jgi:hypothetical protein